MIFGVRGFFTWIDSISGMASFDKFGVVQPSVQSFIWLINQEKFKEYLIPGYFLIIAYLVLGLIDSLIFIFFTSVDDSSKFEKLSMTRL
jgi:hypothetical protein